jgi:hypothetical protein
MQLHAPLLPVNILVFLNKHAPEKHNGVAGAISLQEEIKSRLHRLTFVKEQDHTNLMPFFRNSTGDIVKFEKNIGRTFLLIQMFKLI